jgi:putative flippase GtrA
VLPFGLYRVVPPSFVGFAAINTSTFCADLLILTVLHSQLRVPYPVAVAVGYAVAFAAGFVLNRVLNFRSHDPVGRQVVVYLGVIALNFAILLSASSALEAVGVQYQLARVAAGGCEALFMYAAMRWVVFRGADVVPAPSGGSDRSFRRRLPDRGATDRRHPHR